MLGRPTRVREALIRKVQKDLAHMIPSDLNFSDEFKLAYSADIPGGCEVAVSDPAEPGMWRVYQIKVIEKR